MNDNDNDFERVGGVDSLSDDNRDKLDWAMELLTEVWFDEGYGVITHKDGSSRMSNPDHYCDSIRRVLRSTIDDNKERAMKALEQASDDDPEQN